MRYIGKNANGFNQASQSALVVTVNGIDQATYTTSSYFYSGSTNLVGGLAVTGAVVFSGSLDVRGQVTNLQSGPQNITSSITTPSKTWTIVHNYGQQYVIAQAFDNSFNQIIPK